MNEPNPTPSEEIVAAERAFPAPGVDPIEDVRVYYMGEKGRDKVNGGSPVGPGFVVFERAKGEYGYDLKMAKYSIGQGWRPLVEVLFARIEHDRKWQPKSGFAHVTITQVKEKFGALRIYFHTTSGSYDEVNGFIEALTSMSVRTCEACGKPGKLRGGPGVWWVLTLCDECDDKPREELRTLFEQTEQTDC